MRRTIRVAEYERMYSWENKSIADLKLYHSSAFKQWIAEKMMKFLFLIGVKYDCLEPVQIVRDHHIQADNVLDLILKYNFTVEMMFNQKLKYCIMGYDAFEKLNHEKIHSQFSFDVSYQFRRTIETIDGLQVQAEIYGIKVVVLPWVKGLVMLPELPKENTQNEREEYNSTKIAVQRNINHCYGQRRF